MEKGKKMTCGRALAVTAIATLCCTLDAYAASDPPSQESPSRRWNSNHMLRASMALGEGDFAAMEGVRLSLRYDVPVRKLGSGRLLAGPTAHFMFANTREERAGRAVIHEDRMGQVGVGARYILNLNDNRQDACPDRDLGFFQASGVAGTVPPLVMMPGQNSSGFAQRLGDLDAYGDISIKCRLLFAIKERLLA